MVYKSSFARGFNSSFLNSYVLGTGVFGLLSLLLLILSLMRNPIIENLRYKAISICKPFFIVVGKPFDLINNSLEYFKDLKESKKTNDYLVEENKSLKKQIDKNNFLLLENHRLKQLLKVNEVDYVNKITARILIDSFKDNGSSFYIDVGKNDGLKINDIVFNEKGMIGRIIKMGNKSSKVLSLFNENSVIPVVSVNSKKSFFVEGQSNKLKLKHIEKKFNLFHGEIVVSTDAAGYFKEGIRIGRVFKSLNDVFVIPFAKRTDSIYVNVLIYDFKKEFND